MSKSKSYTYSLWRLEHESVFVITANKVKDTNCKNEVNDWVSKHLLNVASYYREEKELNTNHLQIFAQV